MVARGIAARACGGHRETRRHARAAARGGAIRDRRCCARDGRRCCLLEPAHRRRGESRRGDREERSPSRASRFETFQAALLHEPPLLGKSGKPLQVFTPFWRTLQETGAPRAPLPAPKTDRRRERHRVRQARKLASRTGQARLGRRHARILDTAARRAHRSGCRNSSTTNSQAMQRNATGPTCPAHRGCRRICALARSARFRSGTRRRLVADADAPHGARDVEKFLSEIGWREFCYHLLSQHPDLATDNIDKRFDEFPWRTDTKALARLAEGRDRLSDRRCRHAPALADRLDAQPRAHGRRLVPGQASADRLARRASSGSGTRWSMPTPRTIRRAGNGSRAAAPMPRRISACSIPTLQGEKFDPKGDYVRKFVPGVCRRRNTICQALSRTHRRSQSRARARSQGFREPQGLSASLTAKPPRPCRANRPPLGSAPRSKVRKTCRPATESSTPSATRR